MSDIKHGSDSNFVKPIIANTIQSENQVALSTLSEKDKPWDIHRNESDKIEGYYKNTHYNKYADRIHFCSEFLDFVLKEHEAGEIKLKLKSARFCGYNSSQKDAIEGSAEIPIFLRSKKLEPFVIKHFKDLQFIVVRYRNNNSQIVNGILATIIPRICDVWMDAKEAHDRKEIVLGSNQLEVANRARLLIRALAHTGIIALVDEATGYQYDRASDALSKILEEFIAKELQPWVKTFPDEYYEQLFRLRGLSYPTDSVKKPQYFGYLTNNIIYSRLAPCVLEELRNTVPKNSNGKRKYHYHRKLTSDIGHPKLREHLASVVTIMKLSIDYKDFLKKIDSIHPVYGETISIPFDPDFSDDYTGL